MLSRYSRVALLLPAILLALTGHAAAAPSSQPTRDAKALRIGIDRSHPPFSWIDPEQGPQGFDVAIAKALCAKMDAKCDFIADTRDALIGNLLARRTDAVVASLPITEEARKSVDFTDRYESLAARFVVARGLDIAEPMPEAFKNKIIGVVAGSRYLRYLDAVYAPQGAIIRALPSMEALHTEIQAGRVQAIFGDQTELYHWFDNGTGARCCRFAGGGIRNSKWLGDGGGIAVRREDQGLRDALNRALADILRDGSYDRLNAAYVPFLLY